jgi:L-lactate dehydrogenase complex protein LldG
MSSDENNAARKSIFASIRENLAASAPFDAIHREHQSLHPQLRATHIPKGGQVTSNSISFKENLESVGGRCTIAKSEADAIDAVQKTLDSLHPFRIAVSDSPVIRKLVATLSPSAEVIENGSALDLFNCDVGITGAQWAIADTGTLVLESEKEFSRLTSLVPPVHICLLEPKNIRRTMLEILEIVKTDLNPVITFITGPSRTSDIELTLAIGVHGPRELHVIVIDD